MDLAPALACTPWPDWNFILNNSDYRAQYGEFKSPDTGAAPFAQPPPGAEAAPNPSNGAPTPAAEAMPPCPAQPPPPIADTVVRSSEPITLVSPRNPNECCYSIPAARQHHYNLGRPLLQDGKPLLAKPQRQNQAMPAASPSAGLEPGLRARLSELWTRDALMEHASIAAFAKLSLELMAFGAPSALIEEAHLSALDEAQHARACFFMANQYSSQAISPSGLPLGSSLALASNMAELAANTVLEGCIGETYAALIASEQSAAAEDSHLKSLLSRIADDEARHAAYAWQVLRWALSVGGEAVREAVMKAFEHAFSDTDSGDEEGALEQGLGAHGRLSPKEELQIKKKALSEVISPCFGALFKTTLQ